MNILCLAIDGLHIGQLGCYGSDAVPTPAFDRLASESFVLDQYVLDSPALKTVYRSSWQGVHALNKSADRASIFERLAAVDWRCSLMSDDAALFEDFTRTGLHEVNLLPPSAEQTAESPSETGFARFFEAAVDMAAGLENSNLLWLHSRGLTAPWDAPYSYREELVEDEEEPSPPSMSAVPAVADCSEMDPDELLGIRRAYGGQIKLFDECLAAFLELFAASGLQDDTLLVLMGTRGFPLGEHAAIGHAGERLHEELIHVPCLLQFPDGLGANERASGLAQPTDLAATILDWAECDHSAFDGESLLPLLKGECTSIRDRACSVAYHSALPLGTMPSELAIRTRYWHLRLDLQSTPDDEDSLAVQPSLYVKPDDRWEQNEISSRCPDQVEALRTAIDDLESWLENGEGGFLEPLDECLREHPG